MVQSGRLLEDVDRLKELFDLQLLAAVPDPGAVPFDQVACGPRLGLVLGDEDRGIEPDWLDRCQTRITIPMRKGAGSLNVAVAAGILIHGLSRH
jgi:tRNA G18 (ribose-2'-O)-methylase SpoU